MARGKQATNNGNLNKIEDCYVFIPNGNPSKIEFNNLPDISDTKSAVYNDENIIGRSNPLHTYSHSANRTISVGFHFLIVQPEDAEMNLRKLRTIQSAIYPREGGNQAPFVPPPVCKIKCGDLLATQEVCVVLQSYSVKFPTDVAWWTNGGGGTNGGAVRSFEIASRTTTTGIYCPYKFDVDTSWLVVYSSQDLPFQNNIVQSGYK